jgi:hypothetical protein
VEPRGSFALVRDVPADMCDRNRPTFRGADDRTSLPSRDPVIHRRAGLSHLQLGEPAQENPRRASFRGVLTGEISLLEDDLEGAAAEVVDVSLADLRERRCGSPAKREDAGMADLPKIRLSGSTDAPDRP